MKSQRSNDIALSRHAGAYKAVPVHRSLGPIGRAIRPPIGVVAERLRIAGRRYQEYSRASWPSAEEAWRQLEIFGERVFDDRPCLPVITALGAK